MTTIDTKAVCGAPDCPQLADRESLPSQPRVAQPLLMSSIGGTLVPNSPKTPCQRRYARHRVTWPVTVEANKRLLHGETMDVGPQGAKLRLAERLEIGTRATLHLTPAQGRPMAIEAIVWRIDDDGLAFFFLSTSPNTDEPGNRLPQRENTPPSSKPLETILVVDDELEMLSLAAEVLESRGYTVLKTSDPFEALRMAQTHTEHIQLLLTDIVMPPMNGVKLFDELRAIRPGLRVLFMSAYTTDHVADCGVGLVPGVPLLVKPFGLPELHAKVRSVLDYRSPFAKMHVS